ncbi:hypothetical protein BGW38_008591 [Lunasporangiospora selenospora]|uniref:Uncharacterized protein n=1 Tax=Lunasporangiospora selenospora TaxID=979761 RepID=A0A9P6KGH5_9FUNG|nr:hypothetical protein BGW38_008591 [Lunasporangiospora selenospora]
MVLKKLMALAAKVLGSHTSDRVSRSCRARNNAPTKAAPSISCTPNNQQKLICLRKLAVLFSDESHPGCEGDDAYDNYTDSDLDAGEVDIDPDTDPVIDDAGPPIDNAESHGSVVDDVGGESEAELNADCSIDANFDVAPIMAMTEGTPINRMQKQISDGLREFAVRNVCEMLLKDDFIRMEALQYGGLQITEKAAHFAMTPDEYNEWLQRHQAQIPTNFIQMKDAYKYKMHGSCALGTG